jgi:hypothetical protein
LQQELEFMNTNLKNRKLRAKAEEKPLKYAQKVEKPPQRPPTPHYVPPQEEDDDLEQAAILLQKLIRGRTVQNTMYYGKERRLNLIDELRTRRQVRQDVDMSISEGLDDTLDHLSSEGTQDKKMADQLAEMDRSKKLFNITGGAAIMDATKQQVKNFD